MLASDPDNRCFWIANASVIMAAATFWPYRAPFLPLRHGPILQLRPGFLPLIGRLESALVTLILTIENQQNLPNGAPVSVRLSGARGVEIGRNENLDWTLPDPSRVISGKHSRCAAATAPIGSMTSPPMAHFSTT